MLHQPIERARKLPRSKWRSKIRHFLIGQSGNWKHERTPPLLSNSPLSTPSLAHLRRDHPEDTLSLLTPLEVHEDEYFIPLTNHKGVYVGNMMLPPPPPPPQRKLSYGDRKSERSHSEMKYDMKNFGELKNVDMKNFDLKNFDLKNFDLKNFDLKNFDLKNFDLKNFDLKTFDLKNFGDLAGRDDSKNYTSKTERHSSRSNSYDMKTPLLGDKIETRSTSYGDLKSFHRSNSFDVKYDSQKFESQQKFEAQEDRPQFLYGDQMRRGSEQQAFFDDYDTKPRKPRAFSDTQASLTCFICQELLQTKLVLEKLVLLQCGDVVHGECLQATVDYNVLKLKAGAVNLGDMPQLKCVLIPRCAGHFCAGAKNGAGPVCPIDEEILSATLKEAVLTLKLAKANAHRQDLEDAGLSSPFESAEAEKYGLDNLGVEGFGNVSSDILGLFARNLSNLGDQTAQSGSVGVPNLGAGNLNKSGENFLNFRDSRYFMKDQHILRARNSMDLRSPELRPDRERNEGEKNEREKSEREKIDRFDRFDRNNGSNIGLGIGLDNRLDRLDRFDRFDRFDRLERPERLDFRLDARLDSRPVSLAPSSVTNLTVSVRISEHDRMPLEELKNAFIKHMIEACGTFDLSMLVALGPLRLVDRLLVLLDGLPYTLCKVYLFANFLVVWEVLKPVIFPLAEILEIGTPAFSVVEFTFQNCKVNSVRIHSETDSIIEKWGIAISDPDLIIPLDIFTLTMSVFDIDTDPKPWNIGKQVLPILEKSLEDSPMEDVLSPQLNENSVIAQMVSMEISSELSLLLPISPLKIRKALEADDSDDSDSDSDVELINQVMEKRK